MNSSNVGGAIALTAAIAGVAVVLSNKVGVTPGGQLSRQGVKRHAEETVSRFFPGVDPLMLRAMAEIESSRKPWAFRFETHLGDVSTGLMQTLTTTAQWLWDDMGARAFDRPTMTTLFRPEVSMYFGAAYVNWLRTYRGKAQSEQWIVESYNGGPGNSNSGTRNHWAKYQAAKQDIIAGV